MLPLSFAERERLAKEILEDIFGGDPETGEATGIAVKKPRSPNLNTGSATGLVVFNITPSPNVRTDDDAIRFYTSLLDRLRTLPAIDSATVIATRLGSGWSNNTLVKVDGRNPLGDKLAPVRWNPVGPDFLNVLGTPLLIGRDIAQRDTAATPRWRSSTRHLLNAT
jgi:hypothetical protein